MTPADLALYVLIYLGVAGVWDVLDPRALKIDFNNPARAVFSLVGQVGMLALVLWVVGATAAVCVAVGMGILVLALLRLLVENG